MQVVRDIAVTFAVNGQKDWRKIGKRLEKAYVSEIHKCIVLKLFWQQTEPF